MSASPFLDCVELKNRTGRGVAILVEGEKKGDALYYRQWFGDRPVAFFPHGGWRQVIEAVAKLRQECDEIPVYGIIDRDFAASDALDKGFEQRRILRTPRYTLENYFLDPECWSQVLDFIFWRYDGAPKGWDNPAQIQRQIEQAFAACLTLAAYNWVINFCNDKYAARLSSGRLGRDYYEHPKALAEQTPDSLLQDWGEEVGAEEDLGRLFQDKLRELQTAGLDEWGAVVSGKYVLRELHRRFPTRPGRSQFDLDHYLNVYLDRCPDPPDDLSRLVQRIIEHAGR